MKGKVALALRYEPHDEEGNSRWSADKDAVFAQRHARPQGQGRRRGRRGGPAAGEPADFHEEEDTLVPFARLPAAIVGRIPVLQVTQRVVDECSSSAGVQPT